MELEVPSSPTFQFSCPSCGALLQALLNENLTSVQCGECLDVFEVQMPNLCACAPSNMQQAWPCGGECVPGGVAVMPEEC